jgi:hypothetical protein
MLLLLVKGRRKMFCEKIVYLGMHALGVFMSI